MGRPRTADTCKRMKPQSPTDTKIYHCLRKIGHRGECSAGAKRWPNESTTSGRRSA